MATKSKKAAAPKKKPVKKPAVKKQVKKTPVVAGAPEKAVVVITKKPKPKWFFAAVVAAFILVIGGGGYAYFGVYTQTPENLWKASLKNTRDGLKAFVDKGATNKKGLKVDGTFKMSTPIAADGTVSGGSYDNSADIKFDLGLSGVRANLEVRSLPAVNSDNPDIYLNVSGIANLASLIGLDGDQAKLIDSIDGKWLMADHTLIDEIEQQAGSTAPSLANETPQQIQKDLQTIEEKATEVLNNRLFTDNKSKAVVVITDKLAKEDFEGRKTQHIRVKVQKQQLHDFAVDMKDTLKSTKLNDWLVGTSTSTSFEKITNFDSLLKSIDSNSYSNATADVWIDTGLKTIRNIRIYDSPSNTKNYVDFGFNYTGGDDYPFVIKSVSDNASGKQNVSLGITMNRTTDKMTYSLAGTGTDDAGRKVVDISFGLILTPTDEKMTIVKPANATNVVNLLGGVMSQLQNLQNQLKVVNPVDSTDINSSSLLQ